MKVVVIRGDLLYRIPGYNRDRSFNPKVGKILDLPPEIAEKEIQTGNVRILLEEEKERLKEKKVKKKKKIKKG